MWQFMSCERMSFIKPYMIMLMTLISYAYVISHHIT